MSNPDRPSALVKIGGSLLAWPELPGRFGDFLKVQPDRGERLVLIAGGGATVDVIRELDRAHQFGASGAHYLAIFALDLTASILGRLLPDTRVITDDSEIRECWDAAIIPILAPSRFLQKHESLNGSGLPASWDVTSDSIAAWIAARLHADRLILIKSTDIPRGSSRSRAAAAGLVDPMFPVVARPLREVGYQNLRDGEGALIYLPDEE